MYIKMKIGRNNIRNKYNIISLYLTILKYFIAVKGIKAIGNQFTKFKVKTINVTIPEPEEEEPEGYEEPEPMEGMDEDGGTIGDLFKNDESENTEN